jgi:hypothetical protein
MDKGVSAIAPTSHINPQVHLKEEPEDLASGVLVLRLMVVHDAVGGRQDEVSELPGGHDHVAPALDMTQGDVKPGGDDATLVDATQQLNDDLAAAVVVDDFEFSDVASLLHKLKELDQDLGAGAKEDLSFALFLGVQDVLERNSEDVALHLQTLYYFNLV